MQRSVVTRFDKSQEVSATLSVVVVLRPASGKRLTPGLILGVTTIVSVIGRSIRRCRSPRASTCSIHQSSAASKHIRGILAVRVGETSRSAVAAVSIIPDARYDYGSIGDEINDSFRTSVRMQWRF